MCYQWKEKGQCSKGDNCSFWHDENKRANSTPKSAPPCEPPIEKNEPQRLESIWEVISTTVQRFHQKVSARDHLVMIGILSNVNSTKQNLDVNSGTSARLGTGRLNINPAKTKKRMVTKVQWAILKDARQLGCVFQDIEPSESSSILRKSTKVF